MQATAIKRALISVSDKTDIVAFCQTLVNRGVELISTGGTWRELSDAGMSVQEVSSFTGFPEMMDGRVKTLHPRVHGGLLGRRSPDDLVSDVGTMHTHDILAIDLLVVNLYPFEQVVAAGCTLTQAIENIDIGGPAMVRSAAKNYNNVAVVTDAADYPKVSSEFQSLKGSLSAATRFQLARKAFAKIAAYDVAISAYLNGVDDQKTNVL